jgi:hypothetical protein
MELATKFCDNSACHGSMPCAKCRTQASKIEAEMSALNLQIRAFEEAKVEDLEALYDLLEVLGPFYLHGKALRNAGRLENNLADISKQGVSALVAGAFSSVIEVYEKWGDVAKQFLEKPEGV